jgi:hypothetical protein
MMILGVAAWWQVQMAHASELDPAALAGAADPASAVILLRQGSSTCAGALAQPDGTVITAYHCVADGGPVWVQLRDGRTATGKVASRSPSWDLARVEVPDFAGEPYLQVRLSPLAVGERVRAIGHPLGNIAPGGLLAGTLRWSVSEGTVSAVGVATLQTTAAVNRGNSGGPLVDEAGRLVGIVSRRLGGEALGFAVRAEGVQAILDTDTRGPWIGGSIRADVLGADWGAPGGSPSAGARLEVSARDRLVLAGTVAWAPQPAFDALRFGASTWSTAEVNLGVRQRLFRGYWTLRADAWAGAVLIQKVETVGEPASFLTAISQRGAPAVGGRVSLANIHVDVGVVPLDEGWVVRSALGLRWPGRIGVF